MQSHPPEAKTGM